MELAGIRILFSCEKELSFSHTTYFSSRLSSGTSPAGLSLRHSVPVNPIGMSPHVPTRPCDDDKNDHRHHDPHGAHFGLVGFLLCHQTTPFRFRRSLIAFGAPGWVCAASRTESGPIQALAIAMPRLRPKEFLCASSQLEDVCADTGQRIGGDPPIPYRLVGAFFPMLEWS